MWYNREALECLPKLKQGLFTITAIDNIGHVPSSSTTSFAFYDTSISIFQKGVKISRSNSREA